MERQDDSNSIGIKQQGCSMKSVEEYYYSFAHQYSLYIKWEDLGPETQHWWKKKYKEYRDACGGH